MRQIFSWKPTVTLINALFAKRSRKRPFKIRFFFSLFDELSYNTVKNFVIGGSSSDDGS